MSGALSGLRVLDLSESIAGQFCGRMMADFGASVTLDRAALWLRPSRACRHSIRSRMAWVRCCSSTSIWARSPSLSTPATTEGEARLLELVKTRRCGDRRGKSIATATRCAKRTRQCVVTTVSDFGGDGPYRALARQ
jgi:hypothetical protein